MLTYNAPGDKNSRAPSSPSARGLETSVEKNTPRFAEKNQQQRGSGTVYLYCVEGSGNVYRAAVDGA